MLEGRIDAQGTIADLRQQGVLKHITVEANKETNIAKAESNQNISAKESENGEGRETINDKNQKGANKLIQEEEIVEGRVKPSVYHSYIKAS